MKKINCYYEFEDEVLELLDEECFNITDFNSFEDFIEFIESNYSTLVNRAINPYFTCFNDNDFLDELYEAAKEGIVEYSTIGECLIKGRGWELESFLLSYRYYELCEGIYTSELNI